MGAAIIIGALVRTPAGAPHGSNRRWGNVDLIEGDRVRLVIEYADHPIRAWFTLADLEEAHRQYRLTRRKK